MKYLKQLLFTLTVTGSVTAQAMTIGAAVEGGLWGEYQDGGIGSNYAYVTGDESTTSTPLPAHTYQAEATFNVGALTPVLRAEAYSDDLTPLSDPYISGEAYGLQTYQNTSGSSQTYTLNLNLDGNVLRAPGSSYINTEVNIFSGTDLYASYTSCSGSAEYLSGFGLWSCGTQLATGFTPYIEISSDGAHSISDTVSITIGAGQTFTLYAELIALTFGGHADAFSTLTMQFDDTTNLAALGEMSAVVPVPAAAWLFGSGLLGLIAAARRKA